MTDLAADHLPVTPALEAACQALGTRPKFADGALLRCVRAGIKAERERCASLAESVKATYLAACDADDHERGLHTHHRCPFADLLREGA